MLANLTGWEFRDAWQDEAGYVGLTFFVPLGASGGGRFLERGPVRLKPPGAAGGRQQRAVRSLAEVDETLASVSEAELAEDGLVLEPELRHVLTLSVGRVSVDHRLVSYVGTQRETHHNDGRAVYGGSDLTVVPGDWDALERLDVGPGTRQAVRHAVTYDAAALARRRRQPREVAALQELDRDHGIGTVRVATVDRHGEHVEVPPDALIHYRVTDPVAGPLVRYTRIEERRAA